MYIAEYRKENLFLTKLQNKVKNQQKRILPFYPELMFRVTPWVRGCGRSTQLCPCGQDWKVQVTENKTHPTLG